MTTALIGPTEMFVNTLCQQDKHIQYFRWYWHCRGIEINKNGWRYDLRGNRIAKGKSLEQAAREYGR